MRLRLVDLDGNEPLTEIAGAGPGIGYRRLDCRDLGPRLRLWTTRWTFRAFARRLDAAEEPEGQGPVLTLFGSGDYHHLTTALLARIDEPFTLIHFDNHPDWVRLAPRYHCGAWVNRATQGTYMPGSSFKILVSLAALRAGLLNPEKTYTCNGVYRVGNHDFPCHDRAVHGAIDLTVAIQKSCNVFFYQTGLDLGAEAIAAEARRFHLDVPTGIDLPQETRAMMIPTAQWKKARFKESWTGGDTANMSIGQGAVTITPLQMACFAASVARNELWTQPHILHEPGRPAQRTEPIGLTDEQRALLLKGMEMVTRRGGTAHLLTDGLGLTPLPMRIAGKTGTAQKDTPKGKINFAWFIGFAPLEKDRKSTRLNSSHT